MSRRTVNALLHNHGIRSRSFVEFDVVGDLLERRGFDAILHVLSYTVTTYGTATRSVMFGKDIISLVMRSVINLAVVAKLLGVPLIHVSDDSIFDGRLLTKDDWSETTKPYPTNETGMLHVWAEQLVRSISPEAVIVRLSHLYGFQQDKVRDRVSRQLFVGTAAAALADITRQAIGGVALPKVIHVTNDSTPSSYRELSSKKLGTWKAAQHKEGGKWKDVEHAGLAATPGFYTVPLDVDMEREQVESGTRRPLGTSGAGAVTELHSTRVWSTWRAEPQPRTFTYEQLNKWDHAWDERPFRLDLEGDP